MPPVACRDTWKPWGRRPIGGFVQAINPFAILGVDEAARVTRSRTLAGASSGVAAAVEFTVADRRAGKPWSARPAKSRRFRPNTEAPRWRAMTRSLSGQRNEAASIGAKVTTIGQLLADTTTARGGTHTTHPRAWHVSSDAVYCEFGRQDPKGVAGRCSRTVSSTSSGTARIGWSSSSRRTRRRSAPGERPCCVRVLSRSGGTGVPRSSCRCTCQRWRTLCPSSERPARR